MSSNIVTPNIIIPSWRPKKRNCRYQEMPEGMHEWVYTQAVAAKRFYNEEWEYWVWATSQQHNCSMAEAEDACIRGLKRTLLRMRLAWGEKIGKWFEEYMEMGDIFNKVSQPIWVAEAGDHIGGDGLRR